MRPLSVGSAAPPFELTLKPGEAPLRLADYQGEKPVVLLFFPLAFSSVCTTELRQAAQEYASWKELGTEIVGISVDSPFVNQKFAEECEAPFPIVSDFNRTVVTAYGVRNDDFFGMEGVSNRAAFVVDREGRVVYSWMSEDASVLPDFPAIREAVKACS